MERSISICGRRWTIVGPDDDQYVKGITDPFEPNLTSLLAVMCDEDNRVLDIGANVGCAAIALSQIADRGKVVAFEPVPTTFDCLAANVLAIPNVSIHNFALGSEPGSLPMQGSTNNASGAFISSEFDIKTDTHFEIKVPVRTLDEVFPSLLLDRVDFMKVDVEGFELNVLEGARDVLQKYKPRVTLEMNHFCLNMFRRLTIPVFRERLMEIFPYIYAIDGSEFRDFTNEHEAYAVCHQHITQFRFPDLVAGFDKADLLRRLSTLDRATRIFDHTRAPESRPENKEDRLVAARAEIERLNAYLVGVESQHRSELAASIERQRQLEREKESILASSSWRITRPIRALKQLLT